MRGAVRSVAAAALLLGAALAFAQDDPKADPLDPIRPQMEAQDKLVGEGKADVAVSQARELAKDGTAESWYLLGRALGNAAIGRGGGKPSEAGLRFLDESRECFEKSKEAGGLTYAPAHLGLGRIARFRGDLILGAAASGNEKARTAAEAAAKDEFDAAVKEYRQALQISKCFKSAAIELAQTLWQMRLPSDAEYVLHQFLSERPNDSEARLLLGMLKLQRKRFLEAEPEFRAVLSSDPSNGGARKLLAADLMYQDKFAESAEHWEMVRKADPKDEEAYVSLFRIYRQLKKNDDAAAVLDDLLRELPGTDAAKWAGKLLDERKADPAAWDAPAQDSPETLVRRLDSPDPNVVQKALEEMRDYKWPALPAAVYRLLLRESGTPGQRLAAVRLIGDLGDPQTLTILEILLAHPTEREPDAAVRKEVAHAISRLPTDAIVPIEYEALADPDPDVREWAVQGFAARTGKWFRADLTVRTADADWPSELALYRKWWGTTSASTAKRNAVVALAALYGRVEKGSKVRVARYALPAMDDPIEATWRAGYDFFRAVAFVTFGGDKGPIEEAERARITAEARAWLAAQTGTK